MKTLVTGASGFIGTHLVEELVRRKRKVKCLVQKNTPNDRINFLKSLNVEIVYGNLRNINSLKEAVKDTNIVYHLGAIARQLSLPKSEYWKTNVQGTKNLLEVCRNKKIKKFIHVSSISAIGPSRDGKPVNEKSKRKPIDTYGVSKLLSEDIALDYYKKYKIPIIILRPPMTYGPRDFTNLKIFQSIKKGFFPFFNNGNSKFEFCYIENLIHAFLLAEEKGKLGNIYCISDERAYTIREVAETIAKYEEVKLKNINLPRALIIPMGFLIEQISYPLGIRPFITRYTANWMGTNFWIYDISKAKKELSYKDKYTMDYGIKQTVKWYEEKRYI